MSDGGMVKATEVGVGVGVRKVFPGGVLINV